MSAEAQAPAAAQPAAFELPKTAEEFHLAVANAVGQVLSIPENIQALGQSVLMAAANALGQVSVINQRLEAQPQLTRVEYPNCLRGTIAEGAEVGQYDVKLEQRDEKGEWVPAVRPDFVLLGAKKLMLSQVTFPGDVWFLTTTAQVHAFQDSQIGVATGDKPAAAEEVAKSE